MQTNSPPLRDTYEESPYQSHNDADGTTTTQCLSHADTLFETPQVNVAREPGSEAPPNLPKFGPGRKPRACHECKRQKLRCEVPVGGWKCKHCLRRNVDCSLNFTTPFLGDANTAQAGPLQSRSVAADTYEAKIDLLHQELAHVRSALDTLLQRGASISLPPFQASSREDAPSLEYRVSTQGQIAPELLSTQAARGDNTYMAMTRENSVEPDPATSSEHALNGAVTVEEPMSSLYEVTKLRNIRSNQANTARPLATAEREVSDFITRGVISEQEAQDLYIM